MVVKAIATCTFGSQDNWEKSKITKTMTVEAISKFSHLVCSEKSLKLDFGNVHVGTSAEKKIVLSNPSNVVSNFKIKQGQRNNDDLFEFSMTSGSVQPNGNVELTVTSNL
jgi:hypothetical protein